MLLELALVVSLGVNAFLLLVLLKTKRKVHEVMTQNADALNSLAGDVQNESSVVDSAIVLINGLANRLTDILSQSSGDDLVTQIQTLRDEINQRAIALGQAVATGTAAENDSSNFPSSTGSDTSGESTGEPSSDTSGDSTTGSDSSSGDNVGEGAEGSDATPPSDTSAEAGQPESPAGDGTADVAPPSVADLPPTEDSPPAVETAGDEAVIPDNGEAVPDEGDGA